MLRKLWELAVTLLTVARDLNRFQQEQQKLKDEINSLTIIVHALVQDNRHTKEQVAQQHDNLLLEIENRLLKYERALPPTKRAAKKGGKK